MIWIELFPLLPALTLGFLFTGIYLLIFRRREVAGHNIIRSVETIHVGTFVPGTYHNGLILKPSAAQAGTLMMQLELKLELANLHINPAEFALLSWLGAGAVYTVVVLASHQIAMSIGVALLSLLLPLCYVQVKIWLRLKKAAKQFPDVLDTIANCFKTGFGMHRAMQVVAQKYDDPWGTEFEKMAHEVNFGASLDAVLDNLYKRIPLTEVELFTSALIIQKETGGNLSEVLLNMSHTCRSRQQFDQTIHTLSAQGKLSAMIISCIPFFLMAFIAAILPQPVHVFITNPICQVLIGLALCWMAFGMHILYKITQVEV